PVIVADDSGCGEVVRATGGGQVVPLGDADALARAIESVLKDPTAWRAAAAAAAVRVRAAYGDTVVCSQIEALYGELVAGTGWQASASLSPSTTAPPGFARLSRRSCRRPTAGRWR